MGKPNNLKKVAVTSSSIVGDKTIVIKLLLNGKKKYFCMPLHPYCEQTGTYDDKPWPLHNTQKKDIPKNVRTIVFDTFEGSIPFMPPRILEAIDLAREKEAKERTGLPIK